jgi:hypothetical protein
MGVTMSALDPDPLNPGWVLGWLVVQDPPGRFVNIHPQKSAADTEAMLTPNCTVFWGSHKPGTDEHVYSR